MQSIMKVLLCDSAAALELAGDPLLAAALDWKIKLAVTDLLYERELRTCTADTARRRGFRVEQLAPDGLQRALELRRLHPQLALSDACAVALATQRSWVLLTMNPMLARLAAETGVETRDIEWLRIETVRLESLPPQEDARRLDPAIKDRRTHYGSSEHSSV